MSHGSCQGKEAHTLHQQMDFEKNFSNREEKGAVLRPIASQRFTAKLLKSIGEVPSASALMAAAQILFHPWIYLDVMVHFPFRINLDVY